MIGQTIGQYTILEHIGEGGMGVVYKAQDNKLNRIVALKFLPHHLAKGTTEQSRFLQEAQAAAVLNHPNICVIHDVREEDGKQFIVMEFVEGATIRETIQKGQIKLDTAIDYAIQIAEALEEAHSKGIVHRDIKADNIMINSKNQIKVMDFGLAKLKGSLKLTRTSSTVGTLAYMAPEQMQGGDVDPRSDIFAFGVLFFEMLSGRLPFRGEHEAAMMYSIINEDPENIQKYITDAPAELSFLLKTALEKNPDDRFQHMSDIVRDLRRLKKQSSRVNRPAYSGEYQKFEATKSQSSGAQQNIVEPQNKKKTALFGGIGIAVAVCIVIGIILFMPTEKTPFSSINFSRITSTGKIQSTAISPDSRYISYSQFDKGKYTLWVRQLATSSNIQIKPPQDNYIGDPIFSDDGNFIFYRMSDEKTSENSLYKIPVLGGNPIKIISNVQGPITFSPDGKQIAFNRLYPSTGNFALVVASSDGSQQKDIVAYKGEKWISGTPSWSPKGDMIAVPLGLWKGGFHHELIGVDVETGKETQLTKQTWDGIQNVRWLSDGKGMILEGTDFKTLSSQLYLVTFPSGEVGKITNDLNDYGGTTVTNDFKKLCTVQNEREMYLYFVPNGEAKKSKKIATQRDDGLQGSVISIDNTIYYSSRQSGTFDIWSIGMNGENQKQITFDEFPESQLSLSPNGNRLFFNSIRAGIPNIWSINTDGSSLLQLTQGAEDYHPIMDPSGKWIVFDSWYSGPLTIMKIPAEGGERSDVTTTNGFSPVFMKDGKEIIFVSVDEKRNVNAIYKASLTGGKPEYVFDLPKRFTGNISLRPNSDEVSYTVTNDGVSNIYTRSLDGGSQKQFTKFEEYFIASFAWTPDGKSLVVSRGDIRSDVVIITDEQNKNTK
ncbi:MAG: protein kinase [Bacteroidota bacterium]|nr:protein kinase [Bacteroidota bacterium]